MRLRTIILSLAFILPLTAQAMNTDVLTKSCKANEKACLAYSLGAADRFWLAAGKHESCDTAADKKTIEAMKKAIMGKETLFATKDKQPAAVPLLKYLDEKKLISCSLSTSFGDLTAKCTGTKPEDQKNCRAYIAGVMDAAILMDELHQMNVEKVQTVRPPFCENGSPKKNMSDNEVMTAISDYGRSSDGDKAGGKPAAIAVMEALLKKYSCTKPTAAPAAAAPATEPKTDKK